MAGLTSWTKILREGGVLLAVQLCAGAATYVATAQQNATLRYAEETIGDVCHDVQPVTQDRKFIHDRLQSDSGDNVLLFILEVSANRTRLETLTSYYMSYDWLISISAPVIIAFTMWGIFLIFGWTLCPFCRRYRCFVKERYVPCHCIKGSLFTIWSCLLVLGLLAGAIVAFVGFSYLTDGVNMMECTSGKILTQVVKGDATYPAFVGMFPALQTFENTANLLSAGSPFTQEVNILLNNTTALQQSTYLAQETLALLRSAMSDAKNIIPALPTSSPPVDLMHVCVFCEAMGTLTDPVAQGLSSGVAFSLANARSEVAAQLRGANLDSMRTASLGAASPLADINDMIIENFGWMVDPDGFKQYSKLIVGTNTLLFALEMLIIILATILTFTLMCPLHYFLNNRTSRSEDSPYRKRLHRTACCLCVGSWNFSAAVFFIAGCVWIALCPLSSMCLIMEDIDSAMLRRIYPAFGINQLGNNRSLEMTLSVVDHCISLNTASAFQNQSTNLMDILTLQENASSTKLVTLRQKLLGPLLGRIGEQFANVSEALNNRPIHFGTSNDVIMLETWLLNNSVDSLIMPDMSKVVSAFASMSNSDLTKDGFMTSMSCSDRAVIGSFAGVSGLVRGIDSLFTNLSSLGTQQVGTSCSLNNANMTSCSNPGSQVGNACAAARDFINLKMKIRNEAEFQCNLFQDPTNPAVPCDPKDMIKGVDGKWTNTCLSTSNTLTIFQRTCSLVEFTQYVKDFYARTRNVMDMLDDSVTKSIKDINVTLRGLVDQRLLLPLRTLETGFDCGFFVTFLQSAVDGMCYRGVAGFALIGSSYLASASTTLGVSILSFYTWRFAVDNYNLASKLHDQLSRPRGDNVVPSQG